MVDIERRLVEDVWTTAALSAKPWLQESRAIAG
jgi:hypothetical protein